MLLQEPLAAYPLERNPFSIGLSLPGPGPSDPFCAKTPTEMKMGQPYMLFGPYPQYGWDFPEEIPEKFWKDPGNALRAFPGIPFESTAGMPQTL